MCVEPQREQRLLPLVGGLDHTWVVRRGKVAPACERSDTYPRVRVTRAGTSTCSSTRSWHSGAGTCAPRPAPAPPVRRPCRCRCARVHVAGRGRSGVHVAAATAQHVAELSIACLPALPCPRGYGVCVAGTRKG